jgi:hypothetical protein
MTFAPDLTRNPYAPPTEAPAADPRLLPPLPAERMGEVDIRLTSVERRTMQRRFVCENTADSELLYDAMGLYLCGECIYANGRLRARNLGFRWGWEYIAWVAPRIDFLIEWRGFAAPARLEARMGMTWFHGLRFKHVRLFVAERLVYAEQ